MSQHNRYHDHDDVTLTSTYIINRSSLLMYCNYIGSGLAAHVHETYQLFDRMAGRGDR